MNKIGLKIIYLAIFFILLITVITIQGKNQINQSMESSYETEYWALLVAVAEYADNPDQDRPLMLEETDGFHDLLLTSPIWKEDHIKIIKTEDATVMNILQGLRWLDEMEDSNDMCVFYITTHGFPLGYEFPPFDEDDGTDEALASFWFFAYPTMIITDDEINFMLNQLESQGVCMIVDSCYAGGFDDSPDWNQQNKYASNAVKKDKVINWIQDFGKEVSGQNRVVLMASCEDELSYSGGFAPYILDAMKGYGDTDGDGIVTAEEVFYYVEPRTARQHPTLFDNYPGEFPLITIETETLMEESEGFTKPIVKPVTSFSINQKVCGYITDSEQGYIIENATIEIISGDWWDGHRNTTTSNENGFYVFNIEPGVKRLFAEKTGYLRTMIEPFTVLENQIVWKNISLSPHPVENAVVCGYLKNLESNGPINDSQVIINWGQHYEGYQNSTITDNNGFYSINVASGEIELSFEHDQFIPKVTDEYEIIEEQKLWINESMKPKPTANAILCGYIYDSTTYSAIANSQIHIEWKDTNGNQLTYLTNTNESGFYSMNVATGETYVSVSAQGFDDKSMGRNDAMEDAIRWVNVSLNPERIHLDISTPLNAIYLNNNRIIPSPRCIIIGNIEVEASLSDGWFRSMNDDVTKVEFYLDGELIETKYVEPFIWNWNDKSVGRHVITVIAYDTNGFSVQVEREVLKIG